MGRAQGVFLWNALSWACSVRRRGSRPTVTARGSDGFGKAYALGDADEDGNPL